MSRSTLALKSTSPETSSLSPAAADNALYKDFNKLQLKSSEIFPFQIPPSEKAVFDCSSG